MSNLARWLADLGLDRYLEMFKENEIDADVLPDLTEEDLEKLAIPLGDRKRLIKAILTLSGESQAPLMSPEASSSRDRANETEDETQDLSLVENVEQRRQLTLMFVDLVGSTALSEKLGLEDYRLVIRNYLNTCTRVIRKFNGFIAAYQGDGILAYFGYPQAEEDDALQAVAAGLAVTRAVSSIEANPGVTLQTRVGIATGQVLVGDLIGDDIAIEATVSGETPNLAARLQAIAAPGAVVISDSTRNLLGGQLVCEDLGRTVAKGFSEPVPHWRVRELQPMTSRFESRQHGGLTPFVNREEETALLHRRWNHAKAGNGQVVLISGEAGIGKSRLVQNKWDAITDEPHTRLRYQCSPHHTGSALYPVISQLEFAAGFSPHDSHQLKIEKLEYLLSQGSDQTQETTHLFAKLLAIPAEDRFGQMDLPSALVKDSTLKAMINQLLGLAERRPVLMVFEDLHWIDPTSKELLDLVVERVAGKPILLLCTHRSEYSVSWVGQAAVSVIHVNRLDSEHAAEMVEKLSGRQGIPTQVTEAVLAKTDGVPLFLEELTKTVLESDALHLRAGIRTMEGKLDPLALPSTLKDSLMARLDRLPSAKGIVPVGAAIGRTFSLELLAAVTSLQKDLLKPILDQLVAAGLLFERGQAPDLRYTFKHALVQDAAYETLLRSKMRELHARIATTLENEFPEVASSNPEVIAQHYTRAVVAAKAYEFWYRAAELAIEHSANVEAIAHITAALEQNEKDDNAEERIENEISLREMLCVPLEANSWGSVEIEDNLNRLHQLREERGDEEELFSVLHGLCGTHLIGGKISLARRFATRMLEIATRRDDAAFSVLSHHALGMAAFFLGDFDTALEHFQLVLHTYGPESANAIKKYYVADLSLVEQCMLAWAQLLKGNTSDAQRAIEKAASLVESQDHTFSKAYGLSITASFYQTKGDEKAALHYASMALQVSQDNLLPYWEAWSQIIKGWAMVATGDHGQGLLALREGLTKYAKTGSRQILPYAQALLADAYLRAGRHVEGLAILEDLDAARESNEVRFYDGSAEQIGRRLRTAFDADGSGSAK